MYIIAIDSGTGYTADVIGPFESEEQARTFVLRALAEGTEFIVQELESPARWIN